MKIKSTNPSKILQCCVLFVLIKNLLATQVQLLIIKQCTDLDLSLQGIKTITSTMQVDNLSHSSVLASSAPLLQHCCLSKLKGFSSAATNTAPTLKGSCTVEEMHDVHSLQAFLILPPVFAAGRCMFLSGVPAPLKCSFNATSRPCSSPDVQEQVTAL